MNVLIESLLGGLQRIADPATQDAVRQVIQTAADAIDAGHQDRQVMQRAAPEVDQLLGYFSTAAGRQQRLLSHRLPWWQPQPLVLLADIQGQIGVAEEALALLSTAMSN